MFAADRVFTTASMADKIRRQTRPQNNPSRLTHGSSQGRRPSATEAAEGRGNVEPSSSSARSNSAPHTGRGGAHRTTDDGDSRKRLRTGQDDNDRRKRHGSRQHARGTQAERLGTTSDRPRGKGTERDEDRRKQHTGGAGDGSPRVDQPRGKGRPKKQKEVPGWETCQSNIRCDFCESDLTAAVRHECRLCRFRLCSNCVWNAEDIYDHGPDHVCDEVQPGSEARNEPAADNATSSPSCDVCGAELRDVRYECQECSGVSLCEDDFRDSLHIPGHTLKRFPPPTDDGGHLTSARPSSDAQDVTDERVAEHNAHELSDDAESQSGESYPPDGDVPDWASQGSGHNDEDAGGSEPCLELSDTQSHPSPRRPRLRPAPPRVLDQDRITLSIPPEHFRAFTAVARLILERSEADERSFEAHHAEPKRAGRVKRARRVGEKSGTAWLDEDLEQLRDLKEDGATDAEVARTLGRSVGAVAQQWRKLELGI